MKIAKNERLSNRPTDLGNIFNERGELGGSAILLGHKDRSPVPKSPVYGTVIGSQDSCQLPDTVGPEADHRATALPIKSVCARSP